MLEGERMNEHGLETTYHPYEKLTPPEYFRQGVFRKFPRIINKITIIVVPALFLLGYSVEVVFSPETDGTIG